MPSRTAIIYDDTSIQTATILIRDVDHEGITNKEINSQRLGNRAGGKLVDVQYAPRVIRLAGTIFGTTRSDLETNIDSFLELVNRKERKLDIEYLSGFRRFTVTLARAPFIRRFYAINFAEFELEFVASNPAFGSALDTATVEFLNKTGGTFEGTTGIFTGTFPPNPKIKMTINSQTALSKIVFTNTTTGAEITVERTYAASEVLVIDTNDYTVTVDGNKVDFVGVPPDFELSNDFKIVFTSTAHDVTIKLIYYPLYL